MNFLFLSLVAWIFAPKSFGCNTNSECTNITQSECSLSICQACTSSSSCSQFSLQPYCKLNDRCVECLQTSDCSPLKPNCVSNNCLQCASDTHCATSFPSTPICNLANSTCVECRYNTHCTAVTRSVCSSNTCGPCTVSNDCAHLPSTSTGICVQCLTSNDCPSVDDYFCSATNKCLPCTNNEVILGHCPDTCGNGVRSSPTEQCDDGNLDDGDGCSSICSLEPGWSCNTTTVSDPSECYLPLYMTVQSIENMALQISFNSTVDISDLSPSYISLTLSNLTSSQFKLSYSQVNETAFQVEISLLEHVAYDWDTAKVFINDPDSLFGVFTVVILNNEANVSFPIQNLPEEEQAYVVAAKAIQVAGKAIGYASMASAASSFLLGGSQIFKLMAGIQLMIIPNFFNVNYPKNLQQLLDMAFINIANWINPLQLFRLDRLDAPKRISNKGYDNNFIRANGGYLFFFTFSLVVHVLAKKYIEKFSEKNKKIVNMLNERFGFDSGFKFLVSNSLLFFLPVVLEMKNTTPSAILGLSWAGSLITLAFYIYLPIKTNLTLSKIRKLSPEERKETLEKKKYLYEDFVNADKTDASPFLGTMLILNAFQIIFLVALYNIPALQVGSLVLLDIIHLRLLTTEKPYTDPKTQKFQVSIQSLLLAIKSLILIFVCTLSDEIDGQGNFRITFGWIVGGLCGAFLLTFQVKSLASTVPQLWKVVKKFFRKKPVTPGMVANQPQAQASQQDHIISESASVADSESYAKQLTENGQEVKESIPTQPMNFQTQKTQVDLDITDPEMDNSYAKLNKENSFPDLRRSTTTESAIFKRTKVYHMNQTSLNISTHMKPSEADPQN